MAQKKERRTRCNGNKKKRVFTIISLSSSRKKEKPGKAEEKCEDKRVQREFCTLLLKPLRGLLPYSVCQGSMAEMGNGMHCREREREREPEPSNCGCGH